MANDNSRLNETLLAVGRKGTGKTTIAKAIADATGRKQIVVDTDDHPSYADYELVPLEKLKYWKSGNVRVVTSDPEKALAEINRVCSNAFVILEDAAKYVTANVQRSVKAFIIDHRKRNFDLLIMFHFLADVPPYVAKQYTQMILFKTGDNLDKPQSKFANWHTISKKAQRIKASRSYNYCEIIKIDE